MYYSGLKPKVEQCFTEVSRSLRMKFGTPSVSQGPPDNLFGCLANSSLFYFRWYGRIFNFSVEGFSSFRGAAPIKGMLEFLLIRLLDIHDSRSATEIGVLNLCVA